MSSTDSASVFAILRSQKMNLKHNLRPMLELESGSNDPMAYMLTIVLIQFIQSSGMGVSQIALSFVIQFIVGAAAGYLLGKLAILMLNRLNIDNQSLYPILLLSFVFFTFSVTDLMKGNGYLAVYIAGMMVGNNKIMHRKEIYIVYGRVDMAFPNYHVPLSRSACQSARNAGSSRRSTAHRRIYDCYRAPAQCISLSASIRKTYHSDIQTLRFLGRAAWCGSHYLCHLSGSGRCTRRRRDLQHCIFHHNPISRHSRYYRLKGGTPAGTFHSMEKTGNDFRVELPEEIDSDLRDVTVTQEMLDKKGDTLKNMNLPQGTLVMIVKRGNEYLIPNGTLKTPRRETSCSLFLKRSKNRKLRRTVSMKKNFKPLALHHYKPYICAVLTKVCNYTNGTRTTVH